MAIFHYDSCSKCRFGFENNANESNVEFNWNAIITVGRSFLSSSNSKDPICNANLITLK